MAALAAIAARPCFKSASCSHRAINYQLRALQYKSTLVSITIATNLPFCSLADDASVVVFAPVGGGGQSTSV
jgi:hypothetical protein